MKAPVASQGSKPTFLDRLPWPREWHGIVATAAILIVMTLFSVYLGSGGRFFLPAFIPICMTLCVAADILTCYLLFSQFTTGGTVAFLFIGAAYGTSGLLAIFYLGWFPGVFLPLHVPSADQQVSVSLWTIWHASFALLIGISLAVDPSFKRRLSHDARPAALRMAVLVTLASATIVAAAVIVGRASLPVFVLQGHFHRIFTYAAASIFVLTVFVVATGVVRTKARTPFQYWLLLAVVVCGLDALLNSFAPNRYTLSWYFGKVETLVSSVLLLAVMLAEVASQYNRVFEANELLDTAREAAERSTEFKSRFLANMSHEIRTPMNGIMGMAELLSETKLDSQQRRFLSTMQSSSEWLLTILNDILDLSKAEAGKLHLESRAFNLDALVESTLELFSGTAQRKNLEMSALVQPAVCQAVCGDEGRLRQVLSNLIGNALKFTERGHVNIDVSVESDSREHQLVRFSVTDTGIGIKPEAHAGIFGAFSQADDSVSRRYGGTGLGLSIVRQLAELMGGAAGSESQLGVGSTFWFTVRLRKRFDHTEEATTGTIAELNVLIAEPSDRARRVLTQNFKRWGVAFEEAATGAEAIARATSGAHYHLMLVSASLPDMNPADLAAEVRKVTAIPPDFFLIGDLKA
ncbi:MAG: ATP-binding protein, partial [Candidatus Baltobacteraceae bacterium]